MAAADEEWVRQAAAWLRATTGFDARAVDPVRLRSAVADLPDSAAPLAQRLDADPALEQRLLEAILVGETYFNRQPEDFDYVLQTWLPAWLKRGEKTLRVWSAGCATGEELYSLVAHLEPALPEDTRLDALGTDLLEKSLWTARRGVYGQRSVRASPRWLPELFDSPVADALTVRERLRGLVRFQRHNLLHSPPGSFHLILCRHVMMYF